MIKLLGLDLLRILTYRKRVVEMSQAGQLNPAAQRMAANQFMQMKQANVPQPPSIRDEIAMNQELRKRRNFKMSRLKRQKQRKIAIEISSLVKLTPSRTS